jgi:methyl-accepting chemotaxis protein
MRLSEGDLSARTSLTGNDELSALGRTINHMAQTLEHKMAELAEKEQFLQQLVDAFPDGVRVIAPDYQVLLTNAAYRRQLAPLTAMAPASPQNMKGAGAMAVPSPRPHPRERENWSALPARLSR